MQSSSSAGQAGPSAYPPRTDPRLEPLPRGGGGELGSAASWGRRRGRLFVSPGPAAHVRRRSQGRPGLSRGRPGAQTPGGPTRLLFRTESVRLSRGRTESSPRATTTGWRLRLCASWAGRRAPLSRTPPSWTHSGLMGVRWRSGPPSQLPGLAREARRPPPSSPPLTLREPECKSPAGAWRRGGGAGPKPRRRASRTPWSRRRGPGASRRRRRRWRCGRRGVLLFLQ